MTPTAITRRLLAGHDSSATYPLPASWQTTRACPDLLIEGAGDDFWFHLAGVDDKVGRFWDGKVAEYPMNPESRPAKFVVGADSNLWFIDENRNVIGRLSKDGTISEFAPSISESRLYSLTMGSDCNLWIEQSARRFEFIRP